MSEMVPHTGRDLGRHLDRRTQRAHIERMAGQQLDQEAADQRAGWEHSYRVRQERQAGERDTRRISRAQRATLNGLMAVTAINQVNMQAVDLVPTLPPETLLAEGRDRHQQYRDRLDVLGNFGAAAIASIVQESAQ